MCVCVCVCVLVCVRVCVCVCVCVEVNSLVLSGSFQHGPVLCHFNKVAPSVSAPLFT